VLEGRYSSGPTNIMEDKPLGSYCLITGVCVLLWKMEEKKEQKQL